MNKLIRSVTNSRSGFNGSNYPDQPNNDSQEELPQYSNINGFQTDDEKASLKGSYKFGNKEFPTNAWTQCHVSLTADDRGLDLLVHHTDGTRERIYTKIENKQLTERLKIMVNTWHKWWPKLVPGFARTIEATHRDVSGAFPGPEPQTKTEIVEPKVERPWIKDPEGFGDWRPGRLCGPGFSPVVELVSGGERVFVLSSEVVRIGRITSRHIKNGFELLLLRKNGTVMELLFSTGDLGRKEGRRVARLWRTELRALLHTLPTESPIENETKANTESSSYMTDANPVPKEESLLN